MRLFSMPSSGNSDKEPDDGTLLPESNAILLYLAEGTACSPAGPGSAPSVADLCLYGHARSARTLGGFEMARFPGVRRWLARVAGLPGHVALGGSEGFAQTDAAS